ncbi:MAG: QueT transporter family protein [Firmicutes bacterium]|nr:QueT transporter family protein [Bacillota bacterium]MBR6025865.1 QueT transporter family protein [Bacillota bacterium]
MDFRNLNKTQKLTISAIVMACYIVLMYCTQSFAFGQYQVRIATALYGLAYLFPFLVLPLGLSNLLSNMLMGGLGFFDIVGGGLAGILTAGACMLLGKKKLGKAFIIAPVTLIPALLVSSWLSVILNVPYFALALSLLVGQFIAGVVSALLVKSLARAFNMEK